MDFSSPCPYAHLNERLAKSVDLFLMRKFEQCFDFCKEIISIAKIEPEQERNEEVIEAATALGIQALAEANSWNESFSFVSEVYGTIGLCPPRIIQVCILLHAHMKEYMLCHKLMHTWLQYPANLNHKMCSQVLRIYTQHVLCPTKAFDTLKEMLQSCPSVSDQQKSSLFEQAMSQVDSMKEPVTRLERNFSQHEPVFSYAEALNQIENKRVWFPHENGNNNNDVDHDDDDDEDVFDKDDKTSRAMSDNLDFYSPVQNAIYSFFENLCSFLKSRIKILQNRHVQVMLMAVFAILALFHSQTGDPVSSLGRLVILWQTFLHRIGLIRRR